VDISNWKLEIYDLLAILLPGLVAISEGWIVLRGWEGFTFAMGRITATPLTLLLLASFGVGTIVQELGDFCVKLLTDERYFRRGRDTFWLADEAHPVKLAIKAELGITVDSVDTAFDYCLTKLGARFPKRDMFVATSDLCRSFGVISLLGIIPAIQAAHRAFELGSRFFLWSGLAMVVSLVVFLLSCRRMTRFRGLSDTTVFRAYLATVNESERELAKKW
jgi:hypothetical protein